MGNKEFKHDFMFRNNVIKYANEKKKNEIYKYVTYLENEDIFSKINCNNF